MVGRTEDFDVNGSLGLEEREAIVRRMQRFSVLSVFFTTRHLLGSEYCVCLLVSSALHVKLYCLLFIGDFGRFEDGARIS